MIKEEVVQKKVVEKEEIQKEVVETIQNIIKAFQKSF